MPRTGGAPTRASGIVSGLGGTVKGDSATRRLGDSATRRLGEPKRRARCPIGHPHPLTHPFMRTRIVLLVFLAAAMPSVARAQRTITRDCVDRYDARRYADCRYDVERSRALQREATRERAEQQRERSRWDSIVRQARAQALAYDRAERSRQQSAERAMRTRELRQQRADRERERRETAIRERPYRIRR